MNAIAHDRVAAQRLRGRGMERHEPGFVRLALDDAEDAHLQVHVLTREGQRLTDPQPGGGQEPEQGAARVGAHPAAECAGGPQERRDFVGGVDVRLPTAIGRPE